MKIMVRPVCILALLTLALANPATAQLTQGDTQPSVQEGMETPSPPGITAAPSDEDWMYRPLPERNGAVAIAIFSNDMQMAVMCRDNVLDVMISGLPPAGRDQFSRPLIIQVGDGETADELPWTVATDRDTAFSRDPASTARALAEGGRIQLIVPAARGSRRTRYIMQTAPSGIAIKQVLEVCGRPLIDPREQALDDMPGLPAGIVWERPPRPEFPRPVRGRAAALGYVVLTCVIQTDGRLGDCQIESEEPQGYNLGAAALDAMALARAGQTDEAREAGQAFEGRLVRLAVNFRMNDPGSGSNLGNRN